MSVDLRNQLIISNLPLAEKLAKYKKKDLTGRVNLDDLQSAAYFGLVDAASRFDQSRGDFTKYASVRIMGEMNDCVRKELGLRSPVRCVSLNQFGDVFLADTDTFEDFVDTLTFGLSSREQDLFRMYYLERLTQKQIAERLGVHETIVCKSLKECRGKVCRIWQGREQELRKDATRRSVDRTFSLK